MQGKRGLPNPPAEANVTCTGLTPLADSLTVTAGKGPSGGPPPPQRPGHSPGAPCGKVHRAPPESYRAMPAQGEAEGNLGGRPQRC